MKANIKVPLYKLIPTALLALLRNVVAKMTGNPNFATPAVPLAAMTLLGDQLEVAIEAATNGSRQSKLARDVLVAEARAMLREQAKYVRLMGQDQPHILDGSGYELAKQPEPVGIPAVPKNLVARMTGKDGEVELRWPSVHGAHGYHVSMTATDPAVPGNWEVIGFTTRVRHMVTALESYKAYWFAVTAISVDGESALSDPALGRAA